jgi:hypothetical protein
MTADFIGENILIVGPSTERASELADAIGVSNGILTIETKYFSVKIPVFLSTDPTEISSRTKAVIIEDDLTHISKFEDLADDAIKIFLSDSEAHLDTCIQRGFEFVPKSASPGELGVDFGIPRIKEALKCRIWLETQPSSSATATRIEEPDKLLGDFDDLMQRIKSMHTASKTGLKSDTERRERAAVLASELANLLGVDSDSD